MEREVERTEKKIALWSSEKVDLLTLEQVRFWIAESTEEIHHYDDRKYQFVYLILASFTGAGVLHFFPPPEASDAVRNVLIAFTILLALALVPFVAALQVYTRNRNLLRSDLINANYRLLTQKYDASQWRTFVEESYLSFVSRHNDARKRNPTIYWLIDVLT